MPVINLRACTVKTRFFEFFYSLVIILSENSVNKPWVKEELNASIVKRISKGIKIIPVVLDNCEIPESLKSTVWQKIKNLKEYDKELSNIVASIYGLNNKPPLGLPPEYAVTPIQDIGGLTKTDNLVLKLACDSLMKKNHFIVYIKDLFIKEGAELIPKSQVFESLEVLKSEGYVEYTVTTCELDAFSVTTYGFEEYAKAYVKNYDEIQLKVISEIVNNESSNNEEICKNLDISSALTDHVIDLLEHNDLIRTTKMMGHFILIDSPSPKLKRMLQ